MPEARLPKRIRVSTGSAIVLGLLRGRLDAKPTTIYLLTYRDEKCSANCGFCPQARTSKGRADMLSRVTWPPFPTKKVVSRIGRIAEFGAIKRVCIQSVNYPTVFSDLLSLVREIKSRAKLPVSISCQPLNRQRMETLVEAGVGRISIALDAATEQIFNKIKGRSAGGPYVWERQRESLMEAVEVFGEGSISTHLIVGLGETEKEIVQMIQWCVDSGIYPGLFAFTPIPGTPLESNPQPALSHYRRIQIAHYLVTGGKTRCEDMSFNDTGRLTGFGISKKQLREIVRTGKPFVTSGCPGCNRPYYNERPAGPIYNYPVQPRPEEITGIERQIEILRPRPLGSSE